ncbi:hybrid sensor histidine kinase/response regulator [Fusobacterium phage Fnu1]|uniref:Hybrid sensor histidine kinase/response regulator n=1 Tax=Fusobacterium phage Fnu1 TaxID=2530024 RepID=A0A481W5L8_9CAUD|nr:hybrid sensor histidine kinase/response regulator [Fusobacterium phage Fnu1]QBJ04159.1 hybrid sensor histidine kinase/response regulator [Fusobacterium phage Fnu1]WGH50275.1 putative hybrid sensor histidine kinase/response regulator [Fusobacterium phage vB_FnuS_FNU2]
MINLIVIICIGIVLYILKLVMNKIKEKQEKKLKERINKLTKLQYYTYRYYSNSGKDIIMRELVLDNIEYWEELYVSNLYLTMKRIQNINEELEQRVLFQSARREYNCLKLDVLEKIYKEMKRIRDLESFKEV